MLLASGKTTRKPNRAKGSFSGPGPPLKKKGMKNGEAI